MKENSIKSLFYKLNKVLVLQNRRDLDLEPQVKHHYSASRHLQRPQIRALDHLATPEHRHLVKHK